MLNRPSWFPGPGDSVSDFREAMPLLRRTLIIIHTATIGDRTFTIILIRITGPHTIDPVVTGSTTATIATITSTVRELRGYCLKPGLGEAGKIW
jgi:hypothetical protein